MPSKKYEPTQEEIDRFPKRKNLRFATQNNAWVIRRMVKGKTHVYILHPPEKSELNGNCLLSCL